MELSPLQKRSIFKINPVKAFSEENFKLLDEESWPVRQGWSIGNKSRLRGSIPPTDQISHRLDTCLACMDVAPLCVLAEEAFGVSVPLASHSESLLGTTTGLCSMVCSHTSPRQPPLSPLLLQLALRSIAFLCW